MADIKTKDNAKGTIRTIDKAAVATQRMKQAYIATKEKAERSVNANSSSAEEYASDKLESGIDEVVHDGAYAFDKAGRKGLETTKENIRTAKDGIQRFKQQRAEQSLRKQASQNTSSAIKTVDKAEKTIKQSATSSGKKTIKFAGKEATKTAQKSVKTAEQTAKTAIKTSQQAAKAAQKTAQATVKASQKAAQAAMPAAALVHGFWNRWVTLDLCAARTWTIVFLARSFGAGIVSITRIEAHMRSSSTFRVRHRRQEFRWSCISLSSSGDNSPSISAEIIRSYFRQKDIPDHSFPFP